MADILPCFTSWYTMGNSLLSLEEPGKAKLGAALSVFDLSQEAKLQAVTLVEDRIDGLVQAYKVSSKLGVKLCYGIRFVVCSNLADKEPASRSTESRVTVFIRSTLGHAPLLRLWSRAWTTGHFQHRHRQNVTSYGRLDWAALNELWDEHLMLGLPYFSSFVARNTLTMNAVVPHLPVTRPIMVFKEVGSELPFAPILDAAIDQFVAGRDDVEVVPCKTVLYNRRANFRPFVVKRCIHQHSTWEKPEVDHLVSDAFCFESWKELTQ